MLGFGPPADRHARRQWWRRQIERQKTSRLTVAEFCRRESLTPVTFYSWKRRFQDAPVVPAATGPRPQPKPLTRANQAASPAFVPVTIVDTGSIGPLEIELGNACTLRIKGAVDPELLRVAIHAAGQFGISAQGGH